MTLTPHQQAALCIACGLYLIILGLTSKTLITESDIPATEGERVQAKASPMGRLICVALGFAAYIYGIYVMLR